MVVVIASVSRVAGRRAVIRGVCEGRVGVISGGGGRGGGGGMLAKHVSAGKAAIARHTAPPHSTVRHPTPHGVTPHHPTPPHTRQTHRLVLLGEAFAIVVLALALGGDNIMSLHAEPEGAW